jgi:hypothetical protein
MRAPVHFCNGQVYRMFYVGRHGCSLWIFKCPKCRSWGIYNRHGRCVVSSS